MTLKQLLDRKHIVFDVETFGLTGGVFAVGAVLGRFDLSSDGQHVVWQEILTLAATDGLSARPWALHTQDDGQAFVRGSGARRMSVEVPKQRSVPVEIRRIEPVSRADFDWLEANIPQSVFDPKRLTGDLSIHELFTSFAESHLTDGSAEWWGECPVPCEAMFLREMAERLGAPWGTVKIPPMRDVASLADPLGVTDERPDWALPAHDPLTDAKWSAERLRAAVARLHRRR